MNNRYNAKYWTMCSGKIEYFWHKFGGVKIPNLFLEEYIGNKRKIEKLNDGFKFKIYDKNDDWDIKVIFGYNSEKNL